MSLPSPDGRVVPAAAGDEVVAGAAEQEVGAVAAGNRVVTRAAVDGELDERRQAVGACHRVVAAVGVEHQALAGADVDAEGGGSHAVEADARPVGSHGEQFGAVAAVHFHRVGTVAALAEVRVVAGVPDHAVVAGLSEGLVIGVAAGERVVVGAAEEQVEAALPEQGVIADLPEEHVVAAAAGEDVVAGAAEQVGGGQRAVDLVEGDQRRVGDGGRAAEHRHRPAVHEDVPGRVAVNGDRVVQRVAEDAEDSGAGQEAGGHREELAPLQGL